MKKIIICFLIVFICQHFYLLEDNNKFGVKDKHDNVIIPAQFDDIKYLANNEFIVTLNEKKGVCNTNGTT